MVCSKRVMCTKTDDSSGKLCAMRQAVDGAPAFVYNEHNNAHRAWPGTGANSPQRVQCPLRGADTEDTNVTKKKIGVLGAGTWGMALARMLCVSGNDVQVWSALPAEVENLSATRVHPNLPGMKIPEELQFTKSIEEVCTGKDVLLFAVPSVFVRSTTAKARPYIPDGQILVDVAKGMEPDTLYTMTEVIADELNKEGGPQNAKLVALSGPTHAEEVALDMPTTIVSACPDEAAAEYVQDVFSNTCMRVYTNADIKGVELSGALKNVIALGVGISTGLGYGDNARAALITRGIAEIARLGVAMGCNIHTFAGLAGIGDLIVTATSMHSRNNRAGILIGKGKSPEQAVKEVGMVVEGINALPAAMELAAKYNVEMPIVQTVNAIVKEGMSASDALRTLMDRNRKNEMPQGYEKV
jgi:glycerol-3-phosphate dehydrogenase (NAD(P)+)